MRDVECRECGKKFQAVRSNAKLCSDACRKKRKAWQAREYEKTYVRAPKPRKPFTPKEQTCGTCKKKYMTPTWHYSMYCSQQCAADGNRWKNRLLCRQKHDTPPSRYQHRYRGIEA